MKRIFLIILIVSLVFCLSACGKEKEETADNTGKETETEEIHDTAVSEPEAGNDEPSVQSEENEDDLIDDEAWDALEAIGSVEAENGVFYVYITVPSGLAGEDTTQESLDAQAGETFTAATLNEDGSITYKLTKRQHKTMLNELTEEFDTSLDEMEESQDYAITSIEHNSDFSEFDVYLSTDEVGLGESFMVLALYMYGGMYAIFEGQTADDIIVNYYDSNGALISTANSSDIGE